MPEIERGGVAWKSIETNFHTRVPLGANSPPSSGHKFKEEEMIKKLVTVLGIAMVMGGCAKTYREGLIIDRKLQESQLKQIASSSNNVIDYATQLYIAEPKSKGTDYVTVARDISERPHFNYWESDFIKHYCNDKSGSLYQWYVSRNDYAYGGFRGVNKQLVTCEKNNKIDSAIIYEWYTRDSQAFPYEVYKTFATGDYTYNLLEKSKLSGYKSSNSVLTFPSTRVYDPNSKFQFVHDGYTFIFDYKNNTKKPVEINLLNSSVTINGVKYDMGFEKNRNGQDIIDWTFYNNNEANNVFVGEEGTKLSKLKFNPGQHLYGEFKIKIPGVTKITEEDLKTVIVQLDNIICENFNKISYYDAGKTQFKDRN